MRAVLAAVALGLTVAAAHARLPAPPPVSEAEKAAKAQKDAADKSKEAAELGKAQDKAVASYKKNKSASTDAAARK